MMSTTTQIETTRRRPFRPWRSRGYGIVEAIIVPLGLIVLWIAVTSAGAVDPLFLPSPGVFWDSLVGLAPSLPTAIVTTVAMTLSGFAIGAGSGILVGLLLAYSFHVRKMFGGVFEALRPVPVFALIPLFILWFGLGVTPQIVLVAFGTFVILVVTTLEAVRNVGPVYVKAALNLGADRTYIYRTVIVPSITPHLVGAIRVGAGASWGLGVAAEFIGAQDGLGYLMLNRQTFLDTAGILVIVVIYSVIAFVFDILIRLVQRRALRWTGRSQLSSRVGSVLGVK